MALLGCASNPATGVAASGQRLSLELTTQQYTYRGQERVATIRYQTATGAPAGTAVVYRPQVEQGIELFWRPMQGEQPVDDQDFFRIAGDLDAAEQIREHRDGARFVNRIGFVLLGAGVGTMAVAGRLDSDRSSSVMASVGGAGLLVAVTGALWIYYGVWHNRSENHLFGLERARQAAELYNRAVARQPR